MTDIQTTTPKPERPNLASIRAGLEKNRDEIEKLLKGSGIDVDRFNNTVLVAVQQNPKILDCTPQSIWLSCQQAARDGLLPDGYEGVIIVRKSKNSPRPTASFQRQIGGIRKKVRQSKEIATWEITLIHARDDFDYGLGDDPYIRHKPFLGGDRGPLVGAYSVAVLKSGEKSREVMSIAEINAIRDRYSDSWKFDKQRSPWSTAYGEMVKKTVARRHSKVLPMSSDLRAFINNDDDLADVPQQIAPPKPEAQPKNALDVFAGGNGHAADEPAQEPSEAPEEASEEHDPETGELGPRQWET